jgi:hypothetical protein
MDAEIGNLEADVDIGMAAVRFQIGITLYPNR